MYLYIKAISAGVLVKHNISRLPVSYEDLEAIADGERAVIIPYSQSSPILDELSQKDREKVLNTMKIKKALSLPLKDGTSVILCKDNLPYGERLFAITHELGHIILKHKRSFLFYEKLPEEETDVQEDEANDFAYFLLAPPCILAKFVVLDHIILEELTCLCGTYAVRAMEYVSQSRSSTIMQQEKLLVKKFKGYIRDHKPGKRRTPLTRLTHMGIIFLCAVTAISFGFSSYSAMPGAPGTFTPEPALATAPSPSQIPVKTQDKSLAVPSSTSSVKKVSLPPPTSMTTSVPTPSPTVTPQQTAPIQTAAPTAAPEATLKPSEKSGEPKACGLPSGIPVYTAAGGESVYHLSPDCCLLQGKTVISIDLDDATCQNLCCCESCMKKYRLYQ